jgi:hypothetical protein
MQFKGRQTTDEGAIGTYVVCSPFNGTFFGLNGDRPTDFGSLMLAADYFLKSFSRAFLEGLKLFSNYRNEG